MTNPFAPPTSALPPGEGRPAVGLGWRVLGWVELIVCVAAVGVALWAYVDHLRNPADPHSPMGGGAWIFGVVVGVMGLPIGMLGFTALRGMRWPHEIALGLWLIATVYSALR